MSNLMKCPHCPQEYQLEYRYYRHIWFKHFTDNNPPKAGTTPSTDYTIPELLEKYKKHAYPGEVEQTIEYLERIVAQERNKAKQGLCANNCANCFTLNKLKESNQ